MPELNLDSLVAVEQAGWDSLCAQKGGDFYGSLMTEDALMVLVNAMAMDRATVQASLNQAPAWDSYEIIDPRIVLCRNKFSRLGVPRQGATQWLRSIRSTYDQPLRALRGSPATSTLHPDNYHTLILYQTPHYCATTSD